MDILQSINNRIEQLEGDYQNILATINRIDRDRNELVAQSMTVKGASEELQRLRAEITSQPEDKQEVPVPSDNEENSVE